MHKRCTNERTDSLVLIQNGANLLCSNMFDILDSCEFTSRSQVQLTASAGETLQWELPPPCFPCGGLIPDNTLVGSVVLQHVTGN